MDAERKQRILDQAREKLANPPQLYVARDELHYAIHDPGPPEPQPAYQPQLDTRPPPVDCSAQYVEQRMTQRLAEEREFTRAVVAEALGTAINEVYAEYDKLIAAERKQHKKDLLDVRKSLNDLTIACSKLLGPEQRKAALLALAAMPVHGDMN